MCEGFSFGVYRKPLEDSVSDDDNRLLTSSGSFAEIFNCCTEDLMAAIPPMPDLEEADTGEVDPALLREISAWCCQARANLIKYFQTHPGTNCEILDYLNNIVCPNPNSTDGFGQDFIAAYIGLIAVVLEGIKNCLCLALLPPTPEPTCDVRVPLATVKVRGRDCKILSVCNWTTERKMMITWPAIAHWFGIFSIADFFRELLDTVCCNSLLGLFEDVRGIGVSQQDGSTDMQSFNMTGEASAARARKRKNEGEAIEVTGSKNQSYSIANALSLASGSLASSFSFAGITRNSQNLSKFINGASKRGNKPLELGAVLNGISTRFKLPTNGEKLNSVEASNIPLLMISEIVVKPVFRTVVGDKETDRQIKEFLKGDAKEEQAADATMVRAAAEFVEMKSELNAMKSTLDTQNKEIVAMRKQLKERG